MSKLHYTLALNSATKNPLVNEDWTVVVSIRSSRSVCMTSSNNPSLYGHWSSNNPSLSMIDTSTIVSIDVGDGGGGGESTVLAFAQPLLPSTILNFLFSGPGWTTWTRLSIPTWARSTTVTPLLCSFKLLVDLCRSPKLFDLCRSPNDDLDRWSTSICRLCASKSWIFLRNCFKYSMVSPNMEALSILVTNGTKDLSMMNLSLSFSRRRRSARTWLALSSSWGVPFLKRVIVESASRNLGEFSSRYLVWRNGMLRRTYFRSHWDVLWSIGMRRWWSTAVVHLVNADWVE